MSWSREKYFFVLFICKEYIPRLKKPKILNSEDLLPTVHHGVTITEIHDKFAKFFTWATAVVYIPTLSTRCHPK